MSLPCILQPAIIPSQFKTAGGAVVPQNFAHTDKSYPQWMNTTYNTDYVTKDIKQNNREVL